MDIILGVDPSLTSTGWGVITRKGNALGYVAGGTITTKAGDDMAQRLKTLQDGLRKVIETYQPTHMAIENVFVNSNAKTSLLLGQARGVLMVAGAHSGLPVAEFTPAEVKKALVGGGGAAKGQVAYMVRVLLPRANVTQADTADALAVAICHAHTLQSAITRKAAALA